MTTLLTSAEVAKLLKIPVARARKMAREGQLESVQIGPRTRRFRAEAVNDFIQKNIGEVADGLACDECCSQSGHRTWCPSQGKSDV